MQQAVAKNRISITITHYLDEILDKTSKDENISKSSIIENALQRYLQERLIEEGCQLAKLKFDDLPSEDDWIAIQPKIK